MIFKPFDSEPGFTPKLGNNLGTIAAENRPKPRLLRPDYRKRISSFVVDKLVALSAESLKILIATLPSCVAYCPEPASGTHEEQRHDVGRRNACRERKS